MKQVKDAVLYHVNSQSSINPYRPLTIGNVIETGSNFNPFRNSYESGATPYEYADAAARAYWRFAKEFAIEETRLKINNKLPSRWRSLWLTDKENLSYWEEEVRNNDHQILELQLNGVLFKADAHFIETPPVPLSEERARALRYWSGETIQSGKTEYLFEGKAEVISIVK